MIITLYAFTNKKIRQRIIYHLCIDRILCPPLQGTRLPSSMNWMASLKYDSSLPHLAVLLKCQEGSNFARGHAAVRTEWGRAGRKRQNPEWRTGRNVRTQNEGRLYLEVTKGAFCRMKSTRFQVTRQGSVATWESQSIIVSVAWLFGQRPRRSLNL